MIVAISTSLVGEGSAGPWAPRGSIRITESWNYSLLSELPMLPDTCETALSCCDQSQVVDVDAIFDSHA
jgi:hypothetical protein